jgi:putative endonuclease
VKGGIAGRWFVYVARCSDDTLYVGIARDVAARIAQHDAGKGARYTRGRGPLEVLVTRRCASQGNALRLELALKGLSRQDKHAIVRSPRSLAAFARRVTARAAASTASPPARVPARPAATRASRPRG